MARPRDLLDSMYSRLARCEYTDLQNLLECLLPDSISLLFEPTAHVVSKVIKILNLVHKRVKHNLEIGLPLLKLWILYLEAIDSDSPMVRNFCFVYIEMALQRAHQKDKVDMTGDFVANIPKLPPQHQEKMLRILAEVMGESHSTQVNDEIARTYASIAASEETRIFLEFCLHTVLYQPPQQGGGCPAGLSITQSERVTGKRLLKTSTLLMMKLGILNVVQAMELAPAVVFPLYVAACADCQEPVVKRGEELLKKASDVNYNDVNLINRLYLLFNGTVEVEHIAANSRVCPGNPSLRTRLMSVFCQSSTAANCFPSNLQCIFGCIYGSGTTSRLKQLGMEFAVGVSTHARMDQLKLVGPLLLYGILRFLDDSASKSDDVGDAKIFAFQAIGSLAHRMPQLFREKVDMAVRLFDALESGLTVQEASNSVADAYKGAPPSVLKDLESLLLKNYHAEQSELRFSAVRWAMSIFDLQHCPSRFICMLGASDNKFQIRKMALEGLFLGKDQRTVNENMDLNYPKLGEVLDFIFNQKPALLESAEVCFPLKSYVAMTDFLLNCLVADVEKKNLVESNSNSWPSVEKICLLLEHALGYQGSVEVHANAFKALVTVGSHFPERIALRYAAKLSWLKEYLGNGDLDTRESVARLLGIASCSLSISDVANFIRGLMFSISGSVESRFENKHGVFCALGYVTGNCVSRTPTISTSLLQLVLRYLVNAVIIESATLASIAMEALGHIGLCVQLPPVPNLSSSAPILVLLRDKLSELLSGNNIKPIRKIVIALGHICVKESSSLPLNIALDLIFSLSRSEDEDVLFAAGEALSFLWGGVPVTSETILKTTYTSLSTSSIFLMEDVSSTLSTSTSMEFEDNVDNHVTVRDAVTKQVLEVLLYSSKKEERHAGTVWLLSLTLSCGSHPTIQKLLPKIQEAFLCLIGEQNELTQELASGGLSIVYEIADALMKKKLFGALVETVTGSGERKRADKLSKSTYKELYNLANEMGQPDMIYTFIHLANQSKRGAALGFYKIAKLAGDSLQPHLHSLIPRLYRRIYDSPDVNAQDAMTHIWKLLFPNTKQTIDDHLDLIIEALLLNCGSRRREFTREASCTVLADLIKRRKFDQVGKHLKKIWTATFGAMDDSRETVRDAGDELCRAVSSLTIRLCDISLTDISDAKKTMDIVLPLLLTEGIMSKVDSIRKASIAIMTKLAKGAGTAIGPHLSNLVCCLLEGLSSFGDQELSFTELHAITVGAQMGKPELRQNLRNSTAKNSSIWETLNLCIEVVDDQSLEQLVPRLAQLVRSDVGLNTRVCVAGFISLLVQKVGVSIKPFTAMLLEFLFPAVKEERNSLPKVAFADACAILSKYAGPSQTAKLIKDTAALHTGDKNAQISCACLLRSFSFLATDVLSTYHATVVPIIFLSRFDDDNDVARLYEKLVEELFHNERDTLQRYLKEIVTIISEGMMSSSRIRKKMAAQGIRKLSEVLKKSLSSCHELLLDSLMKEIPGRLWKGKDALLLALAAICKSCGKAIANASPAKPEAILSLVISECKREGKAYRGAALSSLWKVIEAFDNPKFFNMVFPLLYELCNSSQVPLHNNLSDSDWREIVDCIRTCIRAGRATDILGVPKNNLAHVLLVSLALCSDNIAKILLFSSIKELCVKLENGPWENSSLPELVSELFHSVAPKVVECISCRRFGVDKEASDCLIAIIEVYNSRGRFEVAAKARFKNLLIQQWQKEEKAAAKSLLKKCIDIL